LNVIELSATAVGTSGSSTSVAISACCAGAENALTTPRATASAITTSVGASSRCASRPRPPESTIATLWLTSSSVRRFQRSDVLPAHGARTRIGMNCAKFRTPSRSAECVCRYTSSAAARFWNQVPLAESALPKKYGPKVRRRMSANAAAGPTAAELTPDF
jgi:hypothetical protein